MRTLKTFKASLLLTSGFMMLASAALAQEASGDAQEVVVTGKRQPFRGDVPLRLVPQAVQVLDGETLKAAGVTRLDAALDLVPGISRQSNFGGLWDSFAIRGFVGDPNMPSGYLVNGYNEGRGFGGPRDATNLERVEVLKGPGSALFGRGEPGGTINLITKKPKFFQEGSANFSVAEYNVVRGDVDYTNRITDKIAGRISGFYEEGDSFRDTIHTKKYAVNPSFLARLGEDTTLTYDLSITHQEVPFDRGIVVLNGNLDTVPNNRFLGEPGDGPIKINSRSHQLGLAHKLSADWNLLLGLGVRDTTFQGASTEAELAAGRQRVYVDGQNLSRARRVRDYSTTSLLPRAELSGRFNTGPFTHHVLIGGDWEKLDYDVIQYRYRPVTLATQTETSGNTVNINHPAYGKLPVANGLVQSTLEEDRSWGIYLQDQIDITDKIKFRLGGRYDNFEQTYTNRATSVVLEQKVSKFSPMVGLVYDYSPSLSFYTSFAKGFRPQTGADFYSVPFKPEQAKSAEIGMKVSALDGNLSGTVAIYKAQKNNILTADPNPDHANYSVAVGEAESKGVDIDGAWIVSDSFRVMATYAYTDAYVTKGMKDPDFGLSVNAGDPLINVAKHSANLMAFKDFHIGNAVYSLGGRVNYVGKRLGETASTFELPDYTLVNLFAGYKPTEHVKVTLDIFNLFDEDYYTASYSRLWVMPGAPRTAKISLGYSF